MTMHNPPHPGKIIQDVLIDNNGLSINDAAEMLGIARITLSKLINKRDRITPDMASRLSLAFNTSNELWINLQTQYDL